MHLLNRTTVNAQAFGGGAHYLSSWSAFSAHQIERLRRQNFFSEP